METSELKTTLKPPQWQFDYVMQCGEPFYITQSVFPHIGEEAFTLMREVSRNDYTVATWKVTPKNINN